MWNIMWDRKISFNMNKIINNNFSSLLSGKSADWDCEDPQFADKMLIYITSDRVVAIHAAPSKNVGRVNRISTDKFQKTSASSILS